MRDAVFSQYSLETGNGNHWLFTEHNNMFAMAPAQVRAKYYTAIVSHSEGQKASYVSPLQSLLDRLNLQEYWGIKPPVGDFDVERYMEDVWFGGGPGLHFATDPKYVANWKNRHETLFGPLPEQVTAGKGIGGPAVTFGRIGVVVGLAGLGYYIWKKFIK
jgi:hypothetical protein